MRYIKGMDKNQMTMLPLCFDDYIGEDNVCRIINAYVGMLDMQGLGFKYAQAKEVGRMAYNPAKLLSLYIYGYMNRIRSSRRLETETRRNIEVMWLMDCLTPDDKTISNFRKDNAAALKAAFREFSLWCNRQGLYGKELVAVDGTKIRANSSRYSIHTKKGTEKELARLEKKISEYMNALEENDSGETGEPCLSSEAITEALKILHEQEGNFEGWRKRIEENGGAEISVVDPDCRIMRQGGDGRPLDACYNIQTVADEKHKLVVDFEVTSCPDETGGLRLMVERAKEIMEIDKVKAVADKGYYNGEEIADCEQNGTECFIPKMPTVGPSAPDSAYDRKHFKYDAENDGYICPAGETLLKISSYARKNVNGRPVVDHRYANKKACSDCPMRGKCTRDKAGRHLVRSEFQDALDVVNARMITDEGRCILRERKAIIEHPFGTVKRSWGFGNYLCRGRSKVAGEQSLAFLAYNLRRVINIFRDNNENLMAAMG